ncbi:hypothetical protein V3C10_10055 [[Clostridium] symbiosum]|nr:hypothetical protein [[Clostridium] symbiosum]
MEGNNKRMNTWNVVFVGCPITIQGEQLGSYVKGRVIPGKPG